MITLFQGGPVDGHFATFTPRDKKDIRVQYPDGDEFRVAMYAIGETDSTMWGIQLAAAHFVRVLEDSAESLIDWRLNAPY